jgi:photosystem II stability/assembly factor-like uncharacterized protein
MTAVFGLRTGALALLLAMVARAQPVSGANQDAGWLPTRHDACSLSVRRAVMLWAVGDCGKVLKMLDGDTSAGYVIGKGQYDLCGVSFADASHGWIVGSKREDPERGRSVVFKTTTGGDGSQAWTASCPVIRPDINAPFLKVEALDVRHVWLTCGDGYMLYSNDGGVRWAVAARRRGSEESGPVWSDNEK